LVHRADTSKNMITSGNGKAKKRTAACSTKPNPITIFVKIATQ
jgi:hypothetical protein